MWSENERLSVRQTQIGCVSIVVERIRGSGGVDDGPEVLSRLGPQRQNLITNRRVEITTEGGMNRKRLIKLWKIGASKY
jgi:hypothetical protein